MNERPETPQPVPEIPKGPLWASLVAPPVMVFLGNLIASSVPGDKFSVSLFIPLIMFFVIVALTARFGHLVSVRYRGSSVTFLKTGYFLGQIIVCLAVWFGSCLMLFS